MKLLHQYVNGNVSVNLYDDGTKERTYEGIPQPEFPESIDVKITNFCDAGCGFCHEKSTRAGTHADLNELLKVIKCLPAGVELALGGGNALSHPNLIIFLETLRTQGIVPNITINQKHLRPYHNLIKTIITEDLVKGVGISYSSPEYLDDIKQFTDLTNNIVYHLIMGINKVSDINDLMHLQPLTKVLLLGYKQYGFGLNFYLKNKSVEENKYQWYIKLADYFKKNNLVLSFDNLAIEQLKLKRYFTESSWNTFFMGNDGQFTCYIDAVNHHFAKSSTSNNRVSFSEISLLDFFKKLNGV